MLSCEQATQLISRQLDTALIYRERFGLRLHLSMCSACRAYRQQLEFIHSACQNRLDTGHKP